MSLACSRLVFFPRLIKIAVFQEPIFESETFFLSLAPFLVVKVDISALGIAKGSMNKKTNNNKQTKDDNNKQLASLPARTLQ